MRRAWLTRNLVVLTVVSLTQDAASELLYPLLPLFLTGVLAAPPVVLGVVEGCAEAAAGISKYVAGRWSDGRRRLPFVTTGYGMAAAGKVIVAASYVWPMVLVGRVVDRLGKGVRSAPRDALIASSTAPSDFGRAFGFHRMGDSAGAIVGPLLALAALAALDGNVRAAMWWAVVPAVLSTLLTLLVVERRKQAAAPAPHEAHEVVPRSPLPREFWRVCLVLVVIAVVNFPDALLLLRVSELGFTTTQVVLAYVAYNVVYTLGSYPAGAWSDRLPRPLVYGIGLVAFAAAYAGLAVVGHSGWVFVLMAVYGLFPAFTDGVGKAWISTLVPDEHRGRAQGVFQSLSNGAVFLAGLWAGLTWTLGPGSGVVPLLVSGVLGLLAGVVLMIGRHRVTGHPAAV
ncbi:MAG TPA: MFS transporter [Candidatus Nanopelagicales bacterium]|nr:MFS transporter [Candidatus Nanopelagicales bacterium]